MFKKKKRNILFFFFIKKLTCWNFFFTWNFNRLYPWPVLPPTISKSSVSKMYFGRHNISAAILTLEIKWSEGGNETRGPWFWSRLGKKFSTWRSFQFRFDVDYGFNFQFSWVLSKYPVSVATHLQKWEILMLRDLL